jgi:hypothetical protein
MNSRMEREPTRQETMIKMTDQHSRASTENSSYLREYAIRAVKAYLCAACWFGLWMVLLVVGPAVMSVPTVTGPGPPYPSAPWIIAGRVVLGGVVAAGLTLGLAVLVLTGISRHRNRRSGKQDESSASETSDAPDAVEGESHV